MAVPVQTTTTITDTRSQPPRKQAPAHLLEHPQIAAWLDIAEPDQQRDRLARAYVDATERHKAMQRREPAVIAELKDVSRQIAGDAGSKLDKLIRHQSRLNAELAMIADFRVEAAQAHIDAANALGGYLVKHLTRAYNAETDVINDGIAEKRSPQRIADTLPKPPGHAEALAALAAISKRIRPNFERRQVIEQALNVARMLPYDSRSADRLIYQARKG